MFLKFKMTSNTEIKTTKECKTSDSNNAAFANIFRNVMHLKALK